MTEKEEKFCFGTLALGKRYRLLALELAKDLEEYSPSTPLLILTDNPNDFRGSSNILAFKHQQCFWCDNDKSFLIEKALSLFDCCVCIDADMRVLAPVSPDLKWLPGITARSCCTLMKHNTRKNSRLDPHKIAVIKQVAHKLGIDLDDDVKWVHEFLFVVKKDAGKEIEFIKLAKMISRYIELNNIQIGAGTAMGLAAAKVGFPVRQDPVDRIAFFKDRIERQRIKRGKVDSQEKLGYFEKQQKLEFPKYSIPQKIMVKSTKYMKDLLRSTRLKIDTLSDLNFYY